MNHWNRQLKGFDKSIEDSISFDFYYINNILAIPKPTAKSKNSVTELYFDWLNEWVKVEGWIIFLNYTNQNNWIIAESLTLPNQQKVKNTIS